MSSQVFALLAAAAFASAARGAPQDVGVESYARAIVDPPSRAHGDEVGVLTSWLELIERHPDHPLTEAALFALELQGDAWLDASGVPERLAKLSAEKMPFGAKAELARVQGAVRARAAALGDVGANAQPDCLAHVRVLGPLGPLADPFGALEESERLTHPNFSEKTFDAFGHPLAWREFERAHDSRHLESLENLLKVRGGHALVAFLFDAESGGPAWIEIDTRESFAPLAIDYASTANGPWYEVIANPSYAFSFDGEAPVAVDWLAAPQSGLHREPVRLRTGRNQLLLSAAVDGGATFAVRVLDERGLPYPGVRDAANVAPLAAQPSARAPSSAPGTCENYLRALASRGADSEALLGLILCNDGRADEGLAHLARAAELAPDRPGLLALRASLVDRAAYLPETYRRNRSREWLDQAGKLDPLRVDVGLELALRWVPEDKDEEAIARLRAIADSSADPTDALLSLEAVYPKLDMDVQAEKALEELFARTTPRARAYERAAARLGAAARTTSALAAARKALEFGAIDAARRTEIARRSSAAGLPKDAEQWLRSSLSASGSVDAKLELADFYAAQERWRDAEALYAQISELYPSWEIPALRLADVAHAQGELRAETEHLSRARELSPSDRNVARRIAFASTANPLDLDAEVDRAIRTRSESALANYDPKKWSDSLVRVLDWSDVTVFADGGYEMLTHTILHLRDLEACEKEGTQELRGEVLKVATRKAKTGQEFEPVRTQDGYVMPSLEPGDFIETVTREFHGPPSDGLLELTRWSFASVTEPFHLSHYSVSVPTSVHLDIARRHFGELAEITERDEHPTKDRSLFVFESHDVPRVVPEVGAPPDPSAFLPSVAFGTQPDLARLTARLASIARVPTRVTSEIETAARGATDGLASEEARAKALWAFVQKSVDKREATSFVSATSVLLTRQGNPAWLFAALLDAAKIEHDVLWSRNRSPEADLEADEPFFDESRWMGKVLVVVRPKDGAEAWCDPSLKTLPYGKLIADAPRAAAFSTSTRTFVSVPDVALEDRVGQAIRIVATLHADRSADIEATLRFTGNVDFAQKEQLANLPKNNKKRVLAQIGAQIVPGLDLSDFELRGLDSADAPVVFVVKGKVKQYLDESNGDWSAKFPLPEMHFAARLAHGEGERKLHFFLAEPQIDSSEVEWHLDDGLALQGEGLSAELAFEKAKYRLETVRSADGKTITVRRKLAVPELDLAPKDYAGFVEFGARIDEAERVRLRLVKP